jgi:hypothetical protein
MGNDMIESTGYKPTEQQRINDGIAECRRQVKHWLRKLHLLQTERNIKAGLLFVEQDWRDERRWFILMNGKNVGRDYGYATCGQAMAAATQIKAIKEAK